MTASRVNLSEIRAYALKQPYDGLKFLSSLRDLCDTVCYKHFRQHVGDDELYDTAICRVSELLCQGVVDFRFPLSKCFTYLYTTVRNVIGNCLKRRVQEIVVADCGKPFPGREITGESIAHFRFMVRGASEAICGRFAELGVPKECYGGLVWRASFYRALFEKGCF